MASSPTEMAIFERVAARGSFAGAAEDVGLSPSAVAKLITRLEQRLGVRLINRTTRRLALTAEGESYLHRVHEILGAIEAAESEIVSARASLRGHLRVHTFPVIAAHELAQTLPDFLELHPHVTFDFMVTNRSVDLIGENVDVSLRMGPLEDSGLVSRKIVDLSRVVCARRSGTTTVWSRARSSAIGAHMSPVSPYPCSRMTAGPLPPTRTGIVKPV